MSALVTFEEVWDSEFAPKIREKLARRAAQRSEAFLDATLTVGGEEIRQMTPEDLLMLDGFGSPFVCAAHGSSATGEEVDFFIWQLHPTNNHTGSFLNHYRRGLVMGRLRKYGYGKVTEEIWTFCERMFSELANMGDARAVAAGSDAFLDEPRSYFLAPLLVSIASEIGHIDPMSGRLLSQTPLPRLLQYQNATKPEQTRGDDEVTSLRAKCAARLNELNWAIRANANRPEQSSEASASNGLTS